MEPPGGDALTLQVKQVPPAGDFKGFQLSTTYRWLESGGYALRVTALAPDPEGVLGVSGPPVSPE